MKNKETIIIALLIGFIVGIFTGIIIQQMIIVEGVARAGEGWEGVISEMNIEIDINETELVEATYKMFPELNIIEQEQNKK